MKGGIKVDIIQIILLAIATFIFAIDQYSLTELLYRPIISCTIIGLILGDLRTGLIVGGTYDTAHIQMDTNEIMAKSNGTTPTTLHINANGGLVSIGSGGLTVGGDITGKLVGSASSVRDYNNSTVTEFGYSTSGMAVADAVWIGAWDASTSGKYRLRAIQ